MIQEKIVKPLIELLRQGITPEKIALSIAIGAALGVFPIVGTTTILCALAALLLRLNLPAIQLVNYLVYPLQLALLIPFIKVGEALFGAGTLPFTSAQILAQVRSDPWRTAVGLWGIVLHAALAWLMVAPLAALLLYFVLAPLLRRAQFK